MKDRYFYEQCEKNNLKITPQRLTIYKELIKNKDHPSADNIFKRVVKIFPNISFDTVNRTLLTFAEIGITNIVEGYGGPKRFDCDTDNHHHFWCIQCHKILDFHDDSIQDLKLPENIHGYKVQIMKTKLLLEGLCEDCQANSGNN